MRDITYTLVLFVLSISIVSAQALKGTVLDAENNEPIIGANVIIKGTVIGTTTDFDGNFTLQTGETPLPLTIQVSFIGYQRMEKEITTLNTSVEIKLSEDKEMLQEVSVIEQRLSQKQRESALTVEALDNLAIKETPAANFYEALGNLKGVDLTSASIGFKIINTRGFNSTSPVRSLQIIDGVDNQAPGLNFSLGNFLGASELDVQNVDIIAGASTAFYGPGAFNGVISMTTKNPFDYQGISASVKVGERALTETAVRYAEAFKVFNKKYDNVAFKVNLFYLTANDWEATNYNPVDDSPVEKDNPGRYDAINVYGDEDLTGGNDFNNVNNVLDQPTSYAGLGVFYRPGYREEDIVDYDTRNLKTNLGAFFRLTEEIELSYNFNYGTGTTVYQGENRFSLKDIQFYQHIVELKKKDHFYIKAYKTQEDAGNSYDAVLTAFKMNEAVAPTSEWYRQYTALWRNRPPQGYGLGNKFLAIAGYPDTANGQTNDAWFNGPYQDTLAKYNDLLTLWHDSVLGVIDEFSYPAIEAGSPEYDSLLNYVTSRTFTEGGSRFYDRSALYHIMGEYQFNPSWATIKIGGNYRLYLPDSQGNIFDELVFTPTVDSSGNPTTDTSFRKIRNSEFGAYVGVEKKFLGEQLIGNITLRMDKNENFDYRFSPALSIIYNINSTNTVRASFGSAIRNPTLQDQYLRYNVGRAILLGNLNGYDSLVTLESFDFYRNQETLLRRNLDFFDVDPIEPERVRTVEVGYRASLFKRMFVDINYYHNWYTNFIGYQFGLDLTFNPAVPDRFQSSQAYRVAANAKDLVTSQGVNLGVNYYLTDELTLNGNYSFNQLDLRGSDNPIIPAFNTPRNKFNLGFTGRGYKPFKNKDHKIGFAMTYKWVQSFRFEGSPQFTGFINSYGLTDAQVSYAVPKIYTTFKLGASNIMDNQIYQVYGGPSVGRLTYFSILFEKF